MALKKNMVRESDGVSGSYIRLTSYRWDRIAREASAVFSLYDPPRTAPCIPVVAKLRLFGERFDYWLSSQSLAKNENDVVAVLYQAAKVEPLWSNFGAFAFDGAEDV